MDNMKHRRLQELDRSDFEIVEGEPDIRGWDVRNAGGQKIGEVEELIVDAQMKKVRYMVIDMDDNELELEHRKVLMPIGLAELHKEDDDVLLPNIQTDHLRSLPRYDKDELNPEVERQVCSILGRKNETMGAGTESDTEFYKHDYFNDDRLYNQRLQSQNSGMNKESEYEKGLRLWERRSQGGILATEEEGGRSTTGQSGREQQYREREVEEEARMEMVRNRRNNYEQRRSSGSDDRNREDNRSYQRRDHSIEGRIRDEGLREG